MPGRSIGGTNLFRLTTKEWSKQLSKSDAQENRHSVVMVIDDVRHVGFYTVENGLLEVHYDGRTNTTVIGSRYVQDHEAPGHSPAGSARMLLRELAATWRH